MAGSVGVSLAYGYILVLSKKRSDDWQDTMKTYGFVVTSTIPKPVEHSVHPLRSLYKTISWRVVASLDTFLISWLVTGRFALASTIASVEVVTKMFLYYGHERLWLRVRFRNPFRPH